MPEFLSSHPGWMYVAAVLLPLATGTATLVAHAARPGRRRASRVGAILNVGALVAATVVFAFLGLVEFLILNPWSPPASGSRWAGSGRERAL